MIVQKVNKEIWIKSQSLNTYIDDTLSQMAVWDKDHCHFKTFQTHEDTVANCEFAGFPLLLGNTGLILPVRRTRQQADDDNDPTEDSQDKPHLDAMKELGAAWASTMAQNMKARFPDMFFDRIIEKKQSASLSLPFSLLPNLQ